MTLGRDEYTPDGKPTEVTMVNVEAILVALGCRGDHESRGENWDRVFIHVPDPDGGAPMSLGRVMFYRGKFSHVKWYIEPKDQIFPWHRYWTNWHRLLTGQRLITEADWPAYAALAERSARFKWQMRKASRAELPTHNAKGKKVKRRAIQPPKPARALVDMAHEKPEDPEPTPLWGSRVKNKDHCRIKTDHEDCGCAFGQCARGLIF